MSAHSGFYRETAILAEMSSLPIVLALFSILQPPTLFEFKTDKSTLVELCYKHLTKFSNCLLTNVQEN